MTQTPASGPFGPVTVPPRSLLSTGMAAPCWALIGLREARSSTMPTMATNTHARCNLFIAPPEPNLLIYQSANSVSPNDLTRPSRRHRLAVEDQLSVHDHR